MPKLQVVEGNLLDWNAHYIAHQCNCVTKRAAHLAWHMFKAFPHADVYTNRTSSDTPGTIKVCGNGLDQRYVINLFGQFNPGNPDNNGYIGHPSNAKIKKMREDWFLQCLRKVWQLGNLGSLAFPYGIGCGAAGGNWDRYIMMIDKLARHANYPIYIVRLPNG